MSYCYWLQFDKGAVGGNIVWLYRKSNLKIKNFRPKSLSMHCFKAVNSFSSMQMCVLQSHTGNIHCVFWCSSFWGDILAVRGQDYNRLLIDSWWRLHALFLLLIVFAVQEVEEPQEKEAGREYTHTARVEDIRILACVVHQHTWEMQKKGKSWPEWHNSSAVLMNFSWI